eukprot:gnl/TRDRNA2_/TRDRNA2_128862_c0_seq2.p1 gnl/TRDRNA2_/TRDRNA2_128862_c0~~gnl/TRDRNA2_/TRDRNA2_128862_c0_seq2.p1  ORF type:complete len:467 (+),score=83.86 gnl/TRDRNA2_/TRDRNA2_128862_c0_seq2:191-1402(+)
MWAANALSSMNYIFSQEQASMLAQQVPALQAEIARLEKKVRDLEEWKAKTLEDVQALRTEHQRLRTSIQRATDNGSLASAPAAGEKAAAKEPKSISLSLSKLVPSSDADLISSQKELHVRTSLLTNQHPDRGLQESEVAFVELPPEGLSPPPGLGKASRSAGCAADDSQVLPPGAVTRSIAEECKSPQGLKPPPGLPAMPELSRLRSAILPDSALTNVQEGVVVTPSEVEGRPCARAEWRIGNLRTKLRGCMGRALVSPSFSVGEFSNFRLMVYPDAREVVKGPRSRRQKEHYAAMVSNGPLHGALTFKAASMDGAKVLTFYLTVGIVRRGPFTYDFTEQAVHGCSDFGIDWLEQVDSESGSLSVGVEIEGVVLSGSECAASDTGCLMPQAPEEVKDPTGCSS